MTILPHFPADMKWYHGYQAGFEIIVDVPCKKPFRLDIIFSNLCVLAGAGASDIVFEASPDPEQTKFGVRICQLQVQRVGVGLPCTQPLYQPRSVYEEGEVEDFVDLGTVHAGRFCPADYPYSDWGPQDIGGNFILRAVYELPEQAAIYGLASKPLSFPSLSHALP